MYPSLFLFKEYSNIFSKEYSHFLDEVAKIITGNPIINNITPPSKLVFFSKIEIMQTMHDQKKIKYNIKYIFIVNPFEKGCLFKKSTNKIKLRINVIIDNIISFLIN